MSILGNFFLAILLFLSVYSISLIYGKEPPTSGDAVMGYPWAVIYLHLGYLVCLVFITGATAWKGGFDWISPSWGLRYLLVWGGLLLMVITSGASAMLKYERVDVPLFFRLISGFAPILYTLIWSASAVILLNDGIRSGIPESSYRIPLIAGFALGVLGTASLIGSWIQQENRNAQARMQSMQEDDIRLHQQHLDDIDSADASKSILTLLVFTDRNHDQDVREKALAKIKTNPQWQQKLIEILDNDYYTDQAFTFLASNDVDDKSLFAEPVKRGIAHYSSNIRKSIKDAPYKEALYPDLFSYEIMRILRTVDKFRDTGVDYMPAVRDMRAALNQSSEYNKGQFRIIPALDDWIKKNGG